MVDVSDGAAATLSGGYFKSPPATTGKTKLASLGRASAVVADEKSSPTSRVIILCAYSHCIIHQHSRTMLFDGAY